MATRAPNSGFSPDSITAQGNTSVEQNNSFWTHAEIDAARWNQAFPYQLLLVKRNGSQYSQDSFAKQWVFTLPIPPNAISYNMPFAITGEVKLDGYHEQHGGAPIRYISFSGTTGVLPNKGSAEIRQTPPLLSGVFAGTIASAGRVVQSVNLVSAPNIVSDADLQQTIGQTSGYFQFRKLQEFFENYANFKLTKDGRDYVLALCIWKDQAVYLVTPTSFQVPRSADSPYEYPYQLSFRAWKRINLQSNGPSGNAYVPITKDATKLGKLLSAIDAARMVLENSAATLNAVGGDLDHSLFEPLRELSLFAKDLTGVPIAFADLPVQIVRDAKQAIATAIGVQYAYQGISGAFATASSEVQAQAASIAALTAQTNQGTTQGGTMVDALNGTSVTDSANIVLDDPDNHYEFFSLINVAQVNLPPVLVRAIVNERDRVRKTTRLDFENMRDSIVQIMADFADKAGAGSATFSTTYGRPSTSTTRTPSTGDFQTMFALNRVVLELNRLAATGTINRFQINSIDYMAGLASRSGIAFTIPKSKYAVPFPYAMTMEQLSNQYLGDPDRWIEIAALNGLRAPYVDEVGFDLTLLTNGNGNQINVSDSSNLYIGQMVWLVSNTTAIQSRHIIKIDRLNSGQTILTLDGDPTLNVYSTLANATLHAFLPDTVNSMMTIYIPSDTEPQDQDYQTKSIPGVDQFDPLIEAGGVDLLLTNSGDLAITPDGDCRLAIGLTNVIQTARTRLSVTQGTLNRHPQYGLAISTGESTADVDANTLLRSVQDLFSDDPTFTGVTSVSVLKQGPFAQIQIQVSIAGVSQSIPITFNIGP